MRRNWISSQRQPGLGSVLASKFQIALAVWYRILRSEFYDCIKSTQEERYLCSLLVNQELILAVAVATN
jgi:hypothetical protein